MEPDQPRRDRRNIPLQEDCGEQGDLEEDRPPDAGEQQFGVLDDELAGRVGDAADLPVVEDVPPEVLGGNPLEPRDEHLPPGGADVDDRDDDQRDREPGHPVLAAVVAFEEGVEFVDRPGAGLPEAVDREPVRFGNQREHEQEIGSDEERLDLARVVDQRAHQRHLREQERAREPNPLRPVAHDEDDQEAGEQPLLVGKEGPEQFVVEGGVGVVDDERPLRGRGPLQGEHLPEQEGPEQDPGDRAVDRARPGGVCDVVDERAAGASDHAAGPSMRSSSGSISRTFRSLRSSMEPASSS